MSVLKNYEFFKVLYSDIIRGFSRTKTGDYVKHLSESDYADLIVRKEEYVEDLISQGIHTEKQKLEILSSQEVWTSKDEDEILSLKYIISDNTKLIEKMPIASQRAPIEAILGQKKQDLYLLESKRASLVQPTVEFYGMKYYSMIFPQAAIFKDKKMSVFKYEMSDYEKMEDDQIGEINMEYLTSIEKFTERNIRILACLPFVLNQISLCKGNIFSYLGVPISQFTIHQQELYRQAARNINVLENAKGSPPDIQTDTSEQELLDWYDSNYSILSSGGSDANESVGIKTSTNYVNSKH